MIIIGDITFETRCYKQYAVVHKINAILFDKQINASMLTKYNTGTNLLDIEDWVKKGNELVYPFDTIINLDTVATLPITYHVDDLREYIIKNIDPTCTLDMAQEIFEQIKLIDEKVFLNAINISIVLRIAIDYYESIGKLHKDN